MNAMRDRALSAGLVLAAGVAVLAAPTDARAEMWCIRDFGSDRPVCVFATARDCTSAAVIRGGICEREPLGRAAAITPDRTPASRLR
jgi:hypothetical protein